MTPQYEVIVTAALGRPPKAWELERARLAVATVLPGAAVTVIGAASVPLGGGDVAGSQA